MNPDRVPLHKLTLKEKAIVMLLSNLDTSAGLSNGTRLEILEIRVTVLKCKIISGAHKGDIVIIPKINNYGKPYNLGFVLVRYQFPICLSYAMTINKSQGQTFDKVGLYLDMPVFSHGQLYVGCSRVRKA